MLTALSEAANHFYNPALTTSTILSVIGMVLILSLAEFLVYRLISNREFYNRSFNITLAVIPFFIATIVLSLQSNLVITLGTIGALAILRFRTAIKNPVDMLYLLWSVHIGITCGCQLYELAVITFIVVTVILIVFEFVKIGKSSYVLVFHYDGDKDFDFDSEFKDLGCKYRVKSRNYTASGVDYVVEFSKCKTEDVVAKLKEAGIEKLSVMEYDNDDIV